MKIFARIENGCVMELVTPLDGFTIKDSYHPIVASQFIDVTDVKPTPEHGWIYDGNKFAKPPEIPKRPPLKDERYAALEARIAELEKQLQPIQPKKKAAASST